MRVVHELADNVFGATDCDTLLHDVQEYLASKNISADISVESRNVVVVYPNVENIDADEDERIVRAFCTSRNFSKARKVLQEWIDKVPWNSEAYRLLAQIEMETGNIDEAIVSCKDSLKLYPKNLHALILMGNLLARDKGLADEGLAWYKRAYGLYPDSVLAVNNYAGALMSKGDADCAELESLFRKAIELDPSYLNPYYALAGILLERKSSREAFDVVQEGLKRGCNRPENSAPVKEMLTEMLLRLSAELSKSLGGEIMDEKLANVERLGGVAVEIAEDLDLNVPAKMELAERYGRDRHRLVCNPAKVGRARAYYIMHELEKLQLNIEARSACKDASFGHDEKGFERFAAKTHFYITDKFRSSIAASGIDQVIRVLMDGIGGQLMNCPLDFIVAARLYETCPELRPCQVLATVDLACQSLESVELGVRGGFPKNVVRTHAVLNAVSLLQHRELVGIDYSGRLAISGEDMKTAKKLYGIAKETVTSFQPGDEWNLVRTFIVELRCEGFFKVIGGEESRVEEDRQKESNRRFREHFASGENVALNMAITMHMVDAIRRMREMDADKVRIIAAQIAMLGTRGISPDKKAGYSVPALDSEDMSGPRMLAYYYVSWKIGFPEKVGALGLPFEKEYETALAMVNRGM